MDIKAKIEELVNKIKNDSGLLEKFKADPVAAIKELVPVDIPEDTLKQLADGVKAKISVDNLTGAVSGAADKLKGLFGK